jgi:hypothetical protein
MVQDKVGFRNEHEKKPYSSSTTIDKGAKKCYILKVLGWVNQQEEASPQEGNE